MTLSIPISVLDQSPVVQSATSADALRNTIDLAQLCDALGYKRYWVAEHHASPGFAGVAPEALIGPLALATRQIRVGSGGIMLPHYSAFKVAETFGLLAALAPGRIDLGVGRAPGGNQRSAVALQRDRRYRAPDDFPQSLAELVAYLNQSLPADHPFAPLTETLPDGGGRIEPWLLGSSSDSAHWAAEAGIAYCIADFINPDAVNYAEIYRREFRPSAYLDRPYVMAAAWTIAAEDDAQAHRLAAPAAMTFAHLIRGQPIRVPPLDEAVAWLKENPEAAGLRRRSVLGSAVTVKKQLIAIQAEYAADELMLVNVMSDHPARRRSYELIASVFGLASIATA